LDPLNNGEAPKQFDYAVLDWRDQSIDNSESAVRLNAALVQRIEQTSDPVPGDVIKNWLGHWIRHDLHPGIDESYGDVNGGQLMGFLLGLHARRENPDCSIVLMNAYSQEAATRFETRWVRDILGDEGNNTCDVSQDETFDKTSVFCLPFLQRQEMTKALGVLLATLEALSPVLRRLSVLPDLVAGQPQKTVARLNAEYAKALDEFSKMPDECKETHPRIAGPTPTPQDDIQRLIERDIQRLFVEDVY
jgi:hypothetical protein